MKISIIIPAKNVEKYISQCLDSIINQSIDDIEIIVINDNSTDNTRQIVKKYVEMYDNIQLIDTNGVGPGAARNIGMSVSSGEYISFIDGDDYVARSMYVRLYEELLKNDLDIVIYDLERTYANYNPNKDIDDELKINEIAILSSEETMRKYLNGDIESYAWNKIYRRKLLSQSHIQFSENCSMGEDILFNAIAFQNSKKIGLVNNKFYKYRKREGSITNELTREKIYDHCQEIAKTINYLNKYVELNNADLTTYIIKQVTWIFLHLCITLKFNKKNIYETFDSFYSSIDFKITPYNVLKNSKLKFIDKIRYFMLKYRVLDVYFYFRIKVQNI